MLSLYGTPKNMHRLYAPPHIVSLLFSEKKLMDIWHSLWFLRPLIVLVMACPFLIFPALLKSAQEAAHGRQWTTHRP
jgi:hypothetical protein